MTTIVKITSVQILTFYDNTFGDNKCHLQLWKMFVESGSYHWF